MNVGYFANEKFAKPESGANQPGTWVNGFSDDLETLTLIKEATNTQSESAPLLEQQTSKQSERAGQLETASSIEKIVYVDSGGAPVLNRICLEAGPFSSQDMVDYFLSDAKSFSIALLTTRVEQVSEKNYWVTTEKYRSESEIEQKMITLGACDVQAALIDSGDFQNSISLGEYLDREIAINIQHKVIDCGIKVYLRDKTNTTEKIWIKFQGEITSESAFKYFKESNGKYNSISFSNTSCE